MFGTKLGGVFTIISVILLLTYALQQIASYVNVEDPNVITMASRIDRRSTEEIRFNDYQFNLAFEFVTYEIAAERGTSGSFSKLEVPASVGQLETTIVTEPESGGLEFTDIPLVDCKTIYPDMITDESLIGGKESTMYCL